MGAELLDIRAAAALAGRHPETVRRWVWSGRLRAQRRGTRLLVHRAELEELMRGRPAESLAAWRDRARGAQAQFPSRTARGSAADLVLADRTQRSEQDDDRR